MKKTLYRAWNYNPVRATLDFSLLGMTLHVDKDDAYERCNSCYRTIQYRQEFVVPRCAASVLRARAGSHRYLHRMRDE